MDNTFNLLHPSIQKHIIESDWKKLTPIQNQAIPEILKGSNCIIEAPTASGKTEAVFFPALTKILQNKSSSLQILYLSPLKALINDIELRIKKYSELCGIHYFKWHGDVSQRKKIDEFSCSSQILLTTPESLEAILLRKANWPDYFHDLQIIIIDEAHSFAHSDRGSHLISLIKRLEACTTIIPQKIAITATLGKTDEMSIWLSCNGENFQLINSNESEEKLKDLQLFYFNEIEFEKFYTNLYSILNKKKSIVFCKSRTQTEELAGKINQLNLFSKTRFPIQVRTHHSSVSKYFREEAESRIKMKKDFEKGLNAILSTSTLELGIDIGDLDQVLQIHSIESSSSFLQRVGRTGRKQGTTQFFRGFCFDEEEVLILTAVINLGLKNISESILYPKKAYHILAHQIICLSLQNNGISLEEIVRFASNIDCFTDIDESKIRILVDYMIEKNFLREIDNQYICGEETEKFFLGINWMKLFAVFESTTQFEVWNRKSHIGTLDSVSIEKILKEKPYVIILAGIEWEVEKINYDSKKIFVKRIHYGLAPKWSSRFAGCIPIETAKECGRIIFVNEIPNFVDHLSAECLKAYKDKYLKINWKEDSWIIYISKSNNIVIWTFAGDRINNLLSDILQIHNFGQVDSDFKCVTIKTNGNIQNCRLFLEKIINEIIKKENKELYINSLIDDIGLTRIKFKFSKFSICLPKNLNFEAFSDQIYDVNGLINELQNNKMVYYEEND